MAFKPQIYEFSPKPANAPAGSEKIGPESLLYQGILLNLHPKPEIGVWD